jgi:hypothetical protein
MFWDPTEVMEDGGNASLNFGFESDDWGFEFALLLRVFGCEAEHLFCDFDDGYSREFAVWVVDQEVEIFFD